MRASFEGGLRAQWPAMAATDPLHDPRFRLQDNGRFRKRVGALGAEGTRSNQKLCMVTTDLGFLVDLLYGLSLRPDCAHVKHSIVARDGMYLGRCWLSTDAASAQLCEALKRHPRLLVSLQDDAFFNPFRTSFAQQVHAITDVWPDELDAVCDMVEAAFGRRAEAQMVRAVHAAGDATISLLAGTRDNVVGHVLLSPVTLDGQELPRGLGLAPLAVAPDHQGQGVGSRLIEAGLERARQLGYAYVVVLGDPAYYGRFGSQPASDFAMRYPQDVRDGAFRVWPLDQAALSGVQGVVRYLPVFE